MGSYDVYWRILCKVTARKDEHYSLVAKLADALEVDEDVRIGSSTCRFESCPDFYSTMMLTIRRNTTRRCCGGLEGNHYK